MIATHIRYGDVFLVPFKRKPHVLAKHTKTVCQLLLTNCLSVFDHSAGLTDFPYTG